MPGSAIWMDEPGRSRLVTPKLDPDLDGTACAIAYAELLRNLGTHAIPLLSGRPDAEARHVLRHLGWDQPDLPPGPQFVVLVDASDVLGMPDQVDPAHVVEVIDHRLPHKAEVLFPGARIQVEAVGAAATLIEERFVEAATRPSSTSAILLQAAILSNTQRLRGSVTTTRDVEAFERLRATHPLDDAFVNEQFEARGAEIREDLVAAILRETKTYQTSWGRLLFSQLECPAAESLLPPARLALHTLGPEYVLNLVDTATAISILLIPDATLSAWVGEKLGLPFVDGAAYMVPSMLRKQIIARILEVEP